MTRKIVLGSRGSELARTQTEMVATALRSAWPDLAIETKIIRTEGDEGGIPETKSIDPRAGRKGLFTGKIERVLAAGDIDIAVHSAKDLPSDRSPKLEVSAVMCRANVDDILIRKTPGGFASLPSRARIATGSVRRQHQLRWKLPDIDLVELRGNVPTRLTKLVTSDWDAIVLARAGVERLGYDLSLGYFDFEQRKLDVEILSRDEFLPAGGQGVIAMQLRSDDTRTKEIVAHVNHRKTFLCLLAEREFLRLLEGDCNSPVGVLATIEDDEMTLRAQVFGTINEPPKTGKVHSSLRTQEPEKISAALYGFMYGQG